MVIAWILNSMDLQLGKPIFFFQLQRTIGCWEQNIFWFGEFVPDFWLKNNIVEFQTRKKNCDRLLQWDANTMTRTRLVLRRFLGMQEWQYKIPKAHGKWSCIYVSYWTKSRAWWCSWQFLGKKPLPSLGKFFAEVRWEEGRLQLMLSGKHVPAIEVSSLVSKNTTNY